MDRIYAMNIFQFLRRSIGLTLFLLGLALATNQARAASAFLGGFDDLPLMPGMSELQGELMTFDSPTGRIVENSAVGNVNKQAVEAFYRTTLPQLGWKQTGPRLYVREDEILRLEYPAPKGVSSAAPSLTVRFILRPVE